MFKNLNFSLLFVLILLVLSSGSIFQTMGIDEYLQLIVLLIIFVISIKNGFFRNKSKITKLFLITFFTLIIFFVQTLKIGNLLLLFNNNNISILVLITTCVLTSYYFKTKKNFLFNLNFLLKILVLHGIFSSLFLSFFPTESVLFTTISGGSKYLGNYLFFQRTHVNYFGFLDPTYINWFGFNLQRAHGLAWEPGNYAVFVNIVIFLNLFIFKNIRFVIIGVVAVLLSWSTTGIIVMILQFSYSYILSLKKERLKYIIPRLITGSAILIVLLNIVNTNYEEKISGDRSGSGAVRVVNTIASLVTIYENPLIGTGFHWESYDKKLKNTLEYSKSITAAYVDSDKVSEDSSFTNSFLRLFSQLGIPLSLFLVFTLFKQNLVPKHKLLFGTIIIISTSTAPVLLTPFFFIFMINGVLNIIRK